MNRRNFLWRAISGAAAATLNVPLSASESASEKRRMPNVLVLMSDQHKRSCMGAYGDPVAQTPNLDRLAGQSVRFTDAYCTSPICTPSRESFLTGLYNHRLEDRNLSSPFLPKHKTIAHHFNAAGYMTGIIGKTHWEDGQAHGFDFLLQFNDWFQCLGPKTKLYAEEIGETNGGGSGGGLPEIESLWWGQGNPWKGHIELDDRKGPVAVGRVSKLEEKDHFDSFVARESIRFLKTYGHQDQPFFLVSSFLKPHDPFMPAARFAEKFRPEDMKLPDSWGKANLATLPTEVRNSIENPPATPELRDESDAKKRMAYYYGNLAQMDDCLGQVIKALEDLDLDRDTIICYTSDHGEMLGDLGLWQKFQFYEGSSGVPLMIRIPGGRPGVVRNPVSLVSFCATITDLCAVNQVAPNDGSSFAELVRDPAVPHSHGPVFAEYSQFNQHAKYMIRDQTLKYTYWLHDKPELYDLVSDPQELHNLAGNPSHATEESRLRQKLFAWHSPQTS